jgi:hypothetical protein
LQAVAGSVICCSAPRPERRITLVAAPVEARHREGAEAALPGGGLLVLDDVIGGERRVEILVVSPNRYILRSSRGWMHWISAIFVSHFEGSSTSTLIRAGIIARRCAACRDVRS